MTTSYKSISVQALYPETLNILQEAPFKQNKNDIVYENENNMWFDKCR